MAGATGSGSIFLSIIWPPMKVCYVALTSKPRMKEVINIDKRQYFNHTNHIWFNHKHTSSRPDETQVWRVNPRSRLTNMTYGEHTIDQG